MIGSIAKQIEQVHAMKASTIVNKFLADVTPDMHKVRRQSLQVMIRSLLSGADLTVTSLGRHIQSHTTEKHQIKRSTRLCSNVHLHSEISTIYSYVSRRLIGSQQRPIILVDWSDLDAAKRHFLLRAALAVDGRSLTLLEEVHPLSRKEKPAVHTTFMKHLKALLPDRCRPIIVTDAGFRTPWFNLISALGWDFVGRVRNRTFCKGEHDKDWYAAKTLYTQATTKPKALGTYQLCRNQPMDCQLVIVRSKQKGRRDLTAAGERKRKSSYSRSHANREKEPWLLTTSLAGSKITLAKKVVRIYQTRMQIEESFRDLKTGLNFNQNQSYILSRIKVLLLIAMLAQVILFLLGLVTKAMNFHRSYQANSLKNKTVLSYQFLGLRAYRNKQFRIKLEDWRTVLRTVHTLSEEPLSV